MAKIENTLALKDGRVTTIKTTNAEITAEND